LSTELKIVKDPEIVNKLKKDIQELGNLTEEQYKELLDVLKEATDLDMHTLLLLEVCEKKGWDKKKLNSAARVFRFILSKILLKDVTIDDIIDDLKILKLETNDITKITNRLNTATSKENIKNFNKVVHSDDAFSETVPILKNFTHTFDYRIVLDSEGKFVDKVPGVLWKFVTKSDDKTQEILFNMSFREFGIFFDRIKRIYEEGKSVFDEKK